MTMSKMVARSIDLDEIEREVREVARLVGLDRQRGGGGPVSPLEPAFKSGLRAERGAPAIPDTHAGEVAALHFDQVEQVPDAARMPRPSRRSRARLPVSLAVAFPVLLVAAGISAVMATRAPMSAEGEAKADGASPAPPAIVASAPISSPSAPADLSGKPDEPTLALTEQPAAGAAKPAAEQAAAQPAAIALLQPATAAPAPMPTIAATVPLPDAPQASAQSSLFGTPRSVSSLSVKPDGTLASRRKAGSGAVAPAPTPSVASEGARSAAPQAAPDPSQAAAQSAMFGTPRRVASLSVKPDGTLGPSGKAAAGAAAPGPTPPVASEGASPAAPQAAPDASQAAAQSAMFGTPRRVASLSVKADGTLGPNAGAAKPATTLASKDATTSVNAAAPGPATPTAKAHADKDRPRSSRSAATQRPQASKAAMSILPPASTLNAQPRIDAPPPSGNPLTRVTSGFRKVLEMTHIVGPAAGADAQ